MGISGAERSCGAGGVLHALQYGKQGRWAPESEWSKKDFPVPYTNRNYILFSLREGGIFLSPSRDVTVMTILLTTR